MITSTKLSASSPEAEERVRSEEEIGSFAFWNVNAIRPRLQFNTTEITSFLKQHNPDLLFLSELRMIADPRSQSIPSSADKKSRDEQTLWNQALNIGVFKDYKVAGLSLHPSKRYAGTGVLVKKDKFNLVRGVTYDIPRVSGTTTLLSPAASTSSSSTSSSSKQKAKKTTPALTSFFKAVPSPKEASSPPAKKQRLAGPQKHDSEGRVILLELPDFFILHCYVPNNGGNQASFERRQLWDKKVQEIFTKIKEEGGWKGEGGNMKEVFYCGDLNVTPDYLVDVSHPEWFRSKMPITGDPGNSGQPGCTPNEIARFRSLLDSGGLVEVFRELNPFPHPPVGQDLPYIDITANVFTWRGSPGKDSPEMGRYYKKAMRIDLLLATREGMRRVESVEITGGGVDNKDPSFMGSDHCAVIATLKGEEEMEKGGEKGGA
ncbi:hypothetical protein TrCOL_g10612 [Triparma columacea]|uniref:Endonuclease/exonuclease/phosphatase domain-containing protein n=1 Tax=Triparma columacea TaxID=722753 RepID=A0A9W7GI08_9STRA|nr:hypothetical protein TrCOL_g10612 [Triparma columacea]